MGGVWRWNGGGRVGVVLYRRPGRGVSTAVIISYTCICTYSPTYGSKPLRLVVLNTKAGGMVGWLYSAEGQGQEARPNGLLKMHKIWANNG